MLKEKIEKSKDEWRKSDYAHSLNHYFIQNDVYRLAYLMEDVGYLNRYTSQIIAYHLFVAELERAGSIIKN